MAIVQKIIDGNDISQGNSVSWVSKFGDKQRLIRDTYTPDSIGKLNTLYDGRIAFYPNYYTA